MQRSERQSQIESFEIIEGLFLSELTNKILSLSPEGLAKLIKAASNQVNCKNYNKELKAELISLAANL